MIIILSVIVIIYLLYKLNLEKQKPRDDVRRPFSFDEKVKVIEQNVQKYGHARCEKCYSTKDFQIDHFLPLSRGGHNGPDNLQLLCKTHNTRKGNRFAG